VKFNKITSEKVALSANQIGTSEIKSNLAECSQKCMQIPTCQSFTFDSNGHVCIVNIMVYAKASSTAVGGADTVEWFDRIDV
jgi:hypothetical protein